MNKKNKISENKTSNSIRLRKDNELPFASTEMGWKYHHIGIPTEKIFPGEKYIAKYKIYVSGFDTSYYGIEWMRFEKDSPIDEIVKKIPHIAFEVRNIEEVVRGKKLIGEIGSPSKGVKTAMILENGAPVEFIEFK